ncbi:unnamed protein product [Calicophoron daubneyi]|uniref:Thioredoxin-like protein 1 n=1 Tax=Calicophoron daubneyi TaxID=300641 RepID=A0AAV2T1K6_CALDB
MVKCVNEKGELEVILNEASGRENGPGLIVLDFFATWCGPCTEMAPIFKKLSEEHPDVVFLKIDVDKNEDLAEDYNIRTIPTFVFLRGTKQVGRLMGADGVALGAELEKLSKPGPPNEVASSSGSQSSSPQRTDLSPYIAINQCECLNESDAHPLARLLEPDSSDAYLTSDADAELVIFVTFSQFVKLRAIQINGPEENGPKTLKIFINQTATPDFEACGSGKAVQEFTLSPKDLADGASVLLNYVKFQKVTTVTLFIKDNQGGTDVTRIDKLKFFGSPVNTTNMQNFKRVAGKAGEGYSGA